MSALKEGPRRPKGRRPSTPLARCETSVPAVLRHIVSRIAAESFAEDGGRRAFHASVLITIKSRYLLFAIAVSTPLRPRPRLFADSGPFKTWTLSDSRQIGQPFLYHF